MIIIVLFVFFLVWLFWIFYVSFREKSERKDKIFNFLKRFALLAFFLFPWVLNYLFEIDNIYQQISFWTLFLSVGTALFSSIFIILRDYKLPESYGKYCDEINNYCKGKNIDIEIAGEKKSTILLAPAIFAVIMGFILGGVTFLSLLTGGLDINEKIGFTFFYLGIFAFFSWFYKFLIGKINQEALEKLNELEQNYSIEKEKIKYFRRKNCLTKVSSEIGDVLNRIDFPIFISFIIFGIIYFCLYLDFAPQKIETYKYFGYGGVSLHIFTATILFLFDYAGEFFKTPMPKFK